MATFVSFDGMNFHNTDSVSHIYFETNEKIIPTEDNMKKEYLYYIIYADGEEIYRSADYKIYEGRYETSNGMQNFHDNLMSAKKQLL